MIPKLILKEHESKKKEAFYASDFGKLGVDLWLGLKGVPKTNQGRWNDTLRMAAGKGVEMQMLQVLKDSGIVSEDYIQETGGRVNFERFGCEIHGYIDAINLQGEPIEIKTINNANRFDIKKYEDNNPRDNYVGQLAIYMDALGKDTGYLFVSSIDGLNFFWFTCKRLEGRRYQCGNTIVDLDEEYKRWVSIKEMEEPNWNEEVYKLKIEEIDWSKLSKSAITEARMGRKVVGSGWRVLYSSWKDLIIQKQGASIGYSQEEVELIKKLTAGFSAK
jgi:hypothetical protein